MALATKTKKHGKARGTDSSKFKDAVEASSAADNTGVVHEGGLPFVLEQLDNATLKTQAHEMARLVGERMAVREEYLDASRGFRDRLKGLEDRINEIAAEVESGVRKVPAQQNLPAVGAAS